MIFDRLRVEEDLKRIRETTLEQNQQALSPMSESEIALDTDAGLAVSQDATIDSSEQPAEPIDDIRVGAKDILAMSIAIFSLILPFLLVTAAVIGLFLLWFFRNAIF